MLKLISKKCIKRWGFNPLESGLMLKPYSWYYRYRKVLIPSNRVLCSNQNVVHMHTDIVLIPSNRVLCSNQSGKGGIAYVVLIPSNRVLCSNFTTLQTPLLFVLIPSNRVLCSNKGFCVMNTHLVLIPSNRVLCSNRVKNENRHPKSHILRQSSYFKEHLKFVIKQAL